MKLLHRIQPFRIGESTDPPDSLMLFSILLGAAYEAQLRIGQQIEVPPGALLVWHTQGMSLADLDNYLSSGNVSIGRFPKLSERWPKLRDGVLTMILRFAVQHSPTYGVFDEKQLFRILAAVSQTLLIEDNSVRSANLFLASQYRDAALLRMRQPGAELSESTANSAVVHNSAPAPPTVPQVRTTVEHTGVPRQPYSDRVDERGAYFEGAGLRAWYASSRGPQYVKKAENQDAAYLMSDGNRIIFGLADGVTTSTGARFGAAAAVSYFCHNLRDELSATSNPDHEALTRALQVTHSSMNRLLDSLLQRWSQNDFHEVYSEMGRESAALLLENTRSPNHPHWPPALAATLIGGYVAFTDEGMAGYVFRIGDGIVERIGVDEHVTTLFAMDSQVTKISSFFGPGPICGEGLGHGIVTEKLTVLRGELLLLSSDGLTRGHSYSVYHQLELLLGERFVRDLEPNGTAAVGLLKSASSRADELHNSDDGICLFGDNLSFILISPTDGVCA